MTNYLLGRLLSAVWIPATVALMRFGLRWRIEGMAGARRRYRSLRRAGDGPLLVCANHLTLVAIRSNVRQSSMALERLPRKCNAVSDNAGGDARPGLEAI